MKNAGDAGQRLHVAGRRIISQRNGPGLILGIAHIVVVDQQIIGGVWVASGRAMGSHSEPGQSNSDGNSAARAPLTVVALANHAVSAHCLPTQRACAFPLGSHSALDDGECDRASHRTNNFSLKGCAKKCGWFVRTFEGRIVRTKLCSTQPCDSHHQNGDIRNGS